MPPEVPTNSKYACYAGAAGTDEFDFDGVWALVLQQRVEHSWGGGQQKIAELSG
jgi:hypothetical protein